jgi:Rrf2 family protein
MEATRSRDRLALIHGEHDDEADDEGLVAGPAMVDLAMHHDTGPVTLAEIGERQKASLSYLEQLSCTLRRSALASSVDGPGGGYRLAKDIAQVSVADIIFAGDERENSPESGDRKNNRDARAPILRRTDSRTENTATRNG